MSTVLWVNRMQSGATHTDAADKFALYKHLDKLDHICKTCGIPVLSTYCDSTDVRFNTEELDLPEGMTSTDELMAAQGVWIEAQDAERYLIALLAKITKEKIRFGLLRDDHHAVVEELTESLAFAREAAANDAKFNFSIVM